MIKRGFTLIELLVVIAIIALLSTLSVVALNSARSKARDARRLNDLRQITTALEMYHNHTGTYPAIPEGETAITNLCLSDIGISSTCSGLVYLEKIPNDPQGNNYKYHQINDGETYTIATTLENKTTTHPHRDVVLGPNGPEEDLLIANGIDWRSPASWDCSDGSQQVNDRLSYDASLDALKIHKKASCGLKSGTFVPIDTSAKYYFTADYMTINDEGYRFHMGSRDSTAPSGSFLSSNNYFVTSTAGNTGGNWVRVANAEAHTGEKSENPSTSWYSGTTHTQLKILANYADGANNQITYVRNLRFYRE